MSENISIFEFSAMMEKARKQLEADRDATIARLTAERDELRARIATAVKIAHQSDIATETEAWLCRTLAPYEEKP